MSNLEEFKELIKSSLANRGVLESIQSNIRSEIFKSLHDPQAEKDKPEVCQENLMINELIREYLQYNQYINSASVFSLETGTPSEGIDREYIRDDLNLEENESSSRLPLLYGIISLLQNVDHHKKLNPQFAPSNMSSKSQVFQPGDERILGREQNAGVPQTHMYENDSESDQGSSSLPTREKIVSGRQSAASGMGGYSTNDFEEYSEEENPDTGAESSSLVARDQGTSGGSPRSSSERVLPYQYSNEQFDEYDEEEDDENFADSVNVMGIEDLIR